MKCKNLQMQNYLLKFDVCKERVDRIDKVQSKDEWDSILTQVVETEREKYIPVKREINNKDTTNYFLSSFVKSTW